MNDEMKKETKIIENSTTTGGDETLAKRKEMVAIATERLNNLDGSFILILETSDEHTFGVEIVSGIGYPPGGEQEYIARFLITAAQGLESLARQADFEPGDNGA